MKEMEKLVRELLSEYEELREEIESDIPDRDYEPISRYIFRSVEAAHLLCWVMDVLEKNAPRYSTHLRLERNEPEAARLNAWLIETKREAEKARKKEEERLKLEEAREEVFRSLTPLQRKALKELDGNTLRRRMTRPTLGGRK